jgi:hypothetical protein
MNLSDVLSSVVGAGPGAIWVHVSGMDDAVG